MIDRIAIACEEMRAREHDEYSCRHRPGVSQTAYELRIDFCSMRIFEGKVTIGCRALVHADDFADIMNAIRDLESRCEYLQ